MKPMILTEPVSWPNGSNVLGSMFQGTAYAAAVLTREQIMAKHDLTLEQVIAIEDQVNAKTILDARFSWPDGPRYDVMMMLVAFCG